MNSAREKINSARSAFTSFFTSDHVHQDAYPMTTADHYLTPYLGLRARLSQTWINRWTILLLLVLVRTLLALVTLNDNIATARREALSACTSVENVGSAMASMPHYMSQGINELTAKGVEKAIDGLMEMLILTITGVEEIVLFIINLLTSTYLCLITLAVSGGLHVAVSVAEDVANFLNTTMQDVGKDLSSATSDFESAMNGFMADIDKLGSLITGKDLKPPTIDLSTEISALNSTSLPSGYDQGLAKLNASIPTFADVQNWTTTAIKFPFEEVKSLLNESLPKYTMNASLFPVPAKKELTFCSDNNGVNKFFDDLVELAMEAKKIFLVTLIIAAILAMLPMGYRELRRWRFQQRRAIVISSGVSDPMEAVYLVERPYTSEFGIWLSRPFRSSRRKALIRWAVAYATTVPALVVLSLALAGLLSCLCQYILLKVIEKEVPVLENEVIEFADLVINSLNNASEQWAIGTNHAILDVNNVINHDLLGWVSTSTTAVNNTLNLFVDDMVKELNNTFGGTVLYTPIMDVLNCLVLLKIKGIEDGLTWVHDNAHVNFPLLQNDTFSLGTIAKIGNPSTTILATGPNGTAADAISSAVDHVTNVIEKAIHQEAIISFCILFIWFIIVLVGIIRALFLFFGKDDNMYPDSYPTISNPIPTTEKPMFSGEAYTLNPLPTNHIPTYEQALAHSPRSPPYEATTFSHLPANPTDNAANRYNGTKYTLTPTPAPVFPFSSTTATSTGMSSHDHDPVSPILNTSYANPLEERLGAVNGQNVDQAIRRNAHVRTSSCADVTVATPVDGPRAVNGGWLGGDGGNGFLKVPTTGGARSVRDRRDPFADPR